MVQTQNQVMYTSVSLRLVSRGPASQSVRLLVGNHTARRTCSETGKASGARLPSSASFPHTVCATQQIGLSILYCEHDTTGRAHCMDQRESTTFAGVSCLTLKSCDRERNRCWDQSSSDAGISSSANRRVQQPLRLHLPLRSSRNLVVVTIDSLGRE